MLKLAAAATAFLIVTAMMLGPAQAQQPRDPAAAQAISPQDAIIPAGPARRAGEDISPAMLRSVVAWLSRNFDLTPTDVPPYIKFVSPEEIAAHRSRDKPGAAGQSDSPQPGRDTVAVYDTDTRTIYLPADWTGHSPAQLSILVHEMVHHLQTVAGTKFECPQAREQLAYAAQQRWLGLFGSNLETEFQLDPFTLLVTTRCMY